jgi:hypothetical protein
MVENGQFHHGAANKFSALLGERVLEQQNDISCLLIFTQLPKQTINQLLHHD